MPIGTASARLKKALMPRLFQKLGENLCYRCGERIEEDKDLSVEHKLAWFDVDPALFWDLDNVASRRKGVERLTERNRVVLDLPQVSGPAQVRPYEQDKLYETRQVPLQRVS